MNTKLLNFWRSPYIRSQSDRVIWSIIVLARLSLVVAMTWAVFQPDAIVFGMALLALGASFVPTFVERYYNFRLPIEYHLVLVTFLYMSLFLGEVGGAYARFWWWDMVLHASSGVVLGYAGFLTMYVLHARKKINLSPFLVAFFSLCVAVTFGVFWEFFEWSVDLFFGGHMQHGNADTMKDLLVDTIGALLIAVPGYFYFKNGEKSYVERMVSKFLDMNPGIVKKK